MLQDQRNHVPIEQWTTVAASCGWVLQFSVDGCQEICLMTAFQIFNGQHSITVLVSLQSNAPTYISEVGQHSLFLANLIELANLMANLI